MVATFRHTRHACSTQFSTFHVERPLRNGNVPLAEAEQRVVGYFWPAGVGQHSLLVLQASQGVLRRNSPVQGDG